MFNVTSTAMMKKDVLLGKVAYVVVVKARDIKEGEHKDKMFAIKIMPYNEGNEARKNTRTEK